MKAFYIILFFVFGCYQGSSNLESKSLHYPTKKDNNHLRSTYLKEQPVVENNHLRAMRLKMHDQQKITLQIIYLNVIECKQFNNKSRDNFLTTLCFCFLQLRQK